eukprot:gene4220-4916_t
MSKITPFLLDLRKDYDYVTLKRFYEELMLPNFPKEDELEPLDNWVEMFQEGLSTNLDDETLEARANGQDVAPGCEVDFHIILALCPPEQRRATQSDIMGGVVFEFYPAINCGCITYLLVSSEYRGQGLAGQLVNEASARLMENGRVRGHLGGCNAIFLETNSAERVLPEDDVMDPAKRHAIFHKLGVRLLDFDYVQPALSKESGKCKDLLLTCLITPNIPTYTLGTEQRHYLPSALLKSFLRVFWDSCYTRLAVADWESDVDYQRMMDQVNRRERIPLLDLPWERPWTLLDLRDTFDAQPLVVKFYNEILAPNFQASDELEPLESWLSMLPGSQKSGATEDFHLLVALRYPDDNVGQVPIICGGLVFEYHSAVNCGLLTYLLVGGGPNNRAERMARALIQRAVDVLDQNAVERGHLAGCNAIFLETALGAPPAALAPHLLENSNEIVEISYKQEFLASMGWLKVDFCYVQPPLAYDKRPSKALSLVVLVTPRIPLETRGARHYLPSTLLRNFTTSFWRNTCSRTGYWMDDDVDYNKMRDSLSRRARIPLLRMPWQRPFTFVDLAVDFHGDLLASFYNALPPTHDIESLESLQRRLLEARNKLTKEEDLHIVLALNYLEGSKPSIVGGAIFSYFLHSNCGVIQHLLIKKSKSFLDSYPDAASTGGNKKGISLYRGWDVGRELLDEAVDILNRNARTRTHISGPNAIFLETSLSSIANIQMHSPNLRDLTPLEPSTSSTATPVSPDYAPIVHNIQHHHSIINQSHPMARPPTKFHQIPYSYALQQQGWLILDIPYCQPPRGKVQKSGRSSILSVLCTAQLPTLSDEPTLSSTKRHANANTLNNLIPTPKLSFTSTLITPPIAKPPSIDATSSSPNTSQSYVPRDLLRSFLNQYWCAVYSLGREDVPNNVIRKPILISDEGFSRMIDRVKSRERIHLLDLKDPKL